VPLSTRKVTENQRGFGARVQALGETWETVFRGRVQAVRHRSTRDELVILGTRWRTIGWHDGSAITWGIASHRGGPTRVGPDGA